MADLTHRPLRERLQKASEARGRRGGDFDNRARVLAILKLRAEKASLLGFENYAAYAVANQTAETPEAVEAMLSQLTPRAVANARREGAALQALIDREGAGHALEAWDWSFYSEKLRAERYAFDAEALKPYFEMNRVLQEGSSTLPGSSTGYASKRVRPCPPIIRTFRFLKSFWMRRPSGFSSSIPMPGPASGAVPG